MQTGRNFLLCEKDPAFHAGILERLSKVAAAAGAPESPKTNAQFEEDESDWDEAFQRNKKS
jgi:hypothetical protein